MLGRLRRGRLTAEPPREPSGRFGAIETGPPPEVAVPGVGWDQNARALVPAERRAVDSEDLREGMNAIFQKRPPLFRGR